MTDGMQQENAAGQRARAHPATRATGSATEVRLLLPINVEKDGCRTMLAQHAGGRDNPSGTLHQIERKMELVFGNGWLTKR